jgi:hypothetical protein
MGSHGAIFGQIDRLPRLVTFLLKLSGTLLPGRECLLLLSKLPGALIELRVEFLNLFSESLILRQLSFTTSQKKSGHNTQRGLEFLGLFIP